MDKLIEEKKDALLEAARPLMKYLNENHNPHCVILITPTDATILEGKQTTGEILDYVKD